MNGLVVPLDGLVGSGTGPNELGPLNRVIVQGAPELTLLNVTVPPTLMFTVCGPNGVIGLKMLTTAVDGQVLRLVNVQVTLAPAARFTVKVVVDPGTATRH